MQEKSRMASIEKTNSRRWQAGESGNPKGRKRGSGKVSQLRENIAQHLPEIINQLVIKAKSGDAQSAKLLLERVLPPVKSVEQPVEINLPIDADLSTQGQFVIQAIAKGILTPHQGSALLNSIGTLLKIIELDELEKRLSALEQANALKN